MIEIAASGQHETLDNSIEMGMCYIAPSSPVKLNVILIIPVVTFLPNLSFIY